MRDLTTSIPDVNVLLDLKPEELGVKILFLLKNRLAPGETMSLKVLVRELWLFSQWEQQVYPRDKQDQITQALTEAWTWLEAQQLLVPADGLNGRNGWRVLSRGARAMESEAEFASYKQAHLLPKENLHPKIAAVVWGSFVRSQYGSAVFEAMKAVEVSVRGAAGFGDELLGVPLMRKAWNPENGPLTDMESEKGEQRGCMYLSAGATASYKNPAFASGRESR